MVLWIEHLRGHGVVKHLKSVVLQKYNPYNPNIFPLMHEVEGKERIQSR